MTRDSYEADLRGLRADVAALGETVVARLQRAVAAYEQRDRETARSIAESDDEINERYLDLEGECVDLLALQQPVASDLRLVAASFKIITDLERIADLTANLAGYVGEMGTAALPSVPVADIADMTLAQLEGALAAYVEGDAERCRTVAADDRDVDQRCGAAADDLVRFLVTHDHAAGELDALLAETRVFLLTVRDLERIGDHAVNIAARTLYMVENDDDLIH